MDEVYKGHCCPVAGCRGYIMSPGVCSVCGQIKFFKVTQERTSRISYERKIWAPTEEKAKEIVNLGTAWPSSYDDIELEVLSRKEQVAEDITNTDQSIPYRDEAGLPGGIYPVPTDEEIQDFLKRGNPDGIDD